MPDIQKHYLRAYPSGGCTEHWCMSCHTKLTAYEREWQHFSGHADDCPAVLAGLAIDWQKQEDRLYAERYAAMSPEEKEKEDRHQEYVKIFSDRLMKSMAMHFIELSSAAGAEEERKG